MLLGCGSVIASEHGKSQVRLVREQCEGCPGSCRWFGNKDVELWLEEQLRVGTRVGIETSPLALTLGIAVALGLPMTCAFGVYIFFESWIATVIGTVVGVILAIGYCRSRSFNLLLRPRVRNLE